VANKEQRSRGRRDVDALGDVDGRTYGALVIPVVIVVMVPERGCEDSGLGQKTDQENPPPESF
jgi:hypothetical protein